MKGLASSPTMIKKTNKMTSILPLEGISGVNQFYHLVLHHQIQTGIWFNTKRIISSLLSGSTDKLYLVEFVLEQGGKDLLSMITLDTLK